VDDRFYHSFLPPVAKVCGRKLTAFTLWHHFVLSAVGSPVALGGERVSIVDLLVATRVCGLKYGESNISPTLRDAWWKRKLERNTNLFRRETERFYEWMSRQCSPPVFFRGGSAAGGTNQKVDRAPRCLGLACSLMTRGGMSERDAWNCTLGKAMWMDAQFAQLHGIDLRFLDGEDLDDSEINLSNLSDEEAMAKFQNDLPEELVGPTFQHWRENIKGKGGDL
jgi:hypothetical protein